MSLMHFLLNRRMLRIDFKNTNRIKGSQVAELVELSRISQQFIASSSIDIFYCGIYYSLKVYRETGNWFGYRFYSKGVFWLMYDMFWVTNTPSICKNHIERKID